MKFKALLTLLLLIASISLSAQNIIPPASEQFTITGKILNRKDQKPVADANVFISNTTIGSKTDNAGNFTLYNIKPGKYKLVVSIIGFKNYSNEITINDNVKLPDITISPKTIALKEVSIKSKNNGKLYFSWFYEAFKNEFLGTSELAKDCKILNPEALYIDYDEETGMVTATSSGFLEIENKDLGYNIKYLLTDFRLNNKDPKAKEVRYEGSVLFTKMKGTPGQERRWEQRRQDAYEGSSMHFLRAALNDQLDAEGFRALRLINYINLDRPADSLIQAKIKRFNSSYRDEKYFLNVDSLDYWKKKLKLPKIIKTLVPYALNKADIISPTDQPGIFAFGCDSDRLLITYDKNGRFPEFAKLNNINFINYSLNKPNNQEFTLVNFETLYTFFDSNGDIINPYSLGFSGVWAKNRVGDLLPTDYEPGQGKSAHADTLLVNDTLLRSTISRLNTFSTNYPAEKVYLHLDKPGSYFLSDTIWYKAYTVVGINHQLSALSRVLYVELINPKDSVIARQTLHLLSGVAWGDIPLPRTLKQGSYRIRAYTNWMRNTPDCFYDQRIQVGGIAPALTKQATAKNPDVQFFPEGGQLVDGVRSRVAVKSVGTNGLGEDIKGTIEDNEGNVVADFTTQHLGMGVFALIPQSGKTYKARINIPGEAAFTVDLPKAQTSGYTLAINNNDQDSLYVKVAVNDKTLNEQKNSTFYILAQNNGKVYYTSQGKLENLVYTAKVEKNRFPTGITQFTLFSQNGEPLAERITFVQGEDSIKLNISSANQTYTTRQKVKVDIQTKDDANNPVTGSFSVAVINESRAGADENNESTIQNNLLLTSDLKGYIEQPNYYFINNNQQPRQAELDILMLTQGYRRFEWKQVLSNNQPALAYQPEKSLEIAGALKTPAGKAVPNGKITLVATKEDLVSDTTTDVNGNFRFSNINLPDTAKIILRARKENKGSNVAIYVKQPDYPPVLKTTAIDISGRPAAVELTPEMKKNIAAYQAQLKEDSIENARHLKEVVIKGKRLPKPDVYNNYGTALEYDADMKKLSKELVVTIIALQDVIPGLTYSNGVFSYENAIIRRVNIDGIDRKPDEVNFFAPNQLASVRLIDASPARLILTTKRSVGTDTTALKEVMIKDKKPQKAGESNLYGTDQPYTISGARLMQYGNLVQSLIATLPSMHYINGQFLSVKGLPHYLVINGRLANQSELNNYSPNEIEDVKILVGGTYKTQYGILGDDKQNFGPGKDDMSKRDIILITTKQYAGTDTAKVINLKQVNIKSTKINNKPELTNSANLNGPGNANQVIMGDEISGCITISDCLNGKVFGVTFKNGTPYSIRAQNKLGTPPPMVVIIDGNILPGNSLNNLNANDIYSIEVLRSGTYLAIYGSSAPGGALVITTRRGGENAASNDYVTSTVPAGLITYPFKGYFKAKTFYSPVYTHAKTDTEPLDLRSTIYWNPNIVTDKDGNASFEYFNADTKGTYRVVVEGIDDNGNLGRQVYRYKVE